MAKHITKTGYEAITQSIADEVRSTLEVYKMHKAVHNNEERQDLADKLQEAWNITLSLRNYLQRFAGFDEKKFIDQCSTSPQNWRYMNWVNGKYINTSSLRVVNVPKTK